MKKIWPNRRAPGGNATNSLWGRLTLAPHSRYMASAFFH